MCFLLRSSESNVRHTGVSLFSSLSNFFSIFGNILVTHVLKDLQISIPCSCPRVFSIPALGLQQLG
jgi:hypothetical protein